MIHVSDDCSCSSSFRVGFQLRRVSNHFLIRNAASPRAFMSSSIATDAFQESTSSKAYGSEQIQVQQFMYPFPLSYLFILVDVFPKSS